MSAATAKLFTFSLDGSTAELELTAGNTLFDLVKVAFEVCDPRPEETVEDHLWNIKIVNDGNTSASKKFAYYGPVTPEEFYGPHGTLLPDVTKTELAHAGTSLKKGTKLILEYDYGRTSEHTFTVRSVETIENPNFEAYPRRKPDSTIHCFEPFDPPDVNLDEDYSALNQWTFACDGSTEVNLFQAGRKQHYGYLENDNPWVQRMIYLADKPQSLNHYLECLNVGSQVPVGSCASWQSIVVLPAGSKKIDKYCQDLEEGFIDCRVVPENNNGSSDLATIFPKVAALAGFGKDKTVTKGWIRYKNNTLMVVVGTGGTSSRPAGAPKGTSYDGSGFHVPGPSDEILLRRHLELHSLHDLFCAVEGFLQSL